MARQEKRSRMRMLPARIQLQQRSALTGSYPTNVRFSIDGRTGNYPINFDDTKTIDFQNSVSGTINLNDLQQYVIHYQRWNEEEFISDNGTNIYFKQTYVGTPYDAGQDTIIKNANNTGTPGSNNWYKGTSSYIWPTSIAPHKNLGSIYMNGASNRINNTYDYTDIDSNDDFTISMWIKPDSVSGETPLVRLSKNDTGAVGAMSWYFLIVDAQLACILVDAGSQFPIGPAYALAANLTNLINPNEWTHIAVTYSGGGSSGLKFYINGDPISSITGDAGVYTSMGSSNVSLIFGSRITGATEKYYSGYMSEFVYVGATLTDQQINDLYQLNKLGRKVYDKVDLGYAPGIGLPNTSDWLLQSDASDVEEILYSTIVAQTGSVVSNVVDNLPYIHFSPGQDLTPFRDSDQPAVDGKSDNDSFYATGSAVTAIGQGFASPLWSKNKIEIDISVSAACSATLFMSGANWGSATTPPNNTLDKSFEMCYYNFSSKKWEGVGLGIPYGFFYDGTPGYPGAIPGRSIFEQNVMFGFNPGIVNLFPLDLNTTNAQELLTQVTGVFELQAAAGTPMNNFGFPFHPKFHATGSQTLKMDQYINEPFLLEKIVVEMSAAYTIFPETYTTASFLWDSSIANPPVTITSITQSTYPAAINNIFILNQRRPSSYYDARRLETTVYNINNPLEDNFLFTTVPTQSVLSYNANATYVDTIRDLITWGGVTSFAANAVSSAYRAGTPRYANLPVAAETRNPRNLMTRDFTFNSNNEAHNNLANLSWSGSLKLELPAKSPVRIDRNVVGGISYDNISSYMFAAAGNNVGTAPGALHGLVYGEGGRNGLGIKVPNGRNYISPIANIESNSTYQNRFGGVSTDTILVNEENRYRYNPYILMPTDELIIGWQQPILNFAVVYASLTAPTTRGALNAYSGSFSEIKFLPGDAKITLYGSYIRNGKEYNDSLNQLLSSDNIHEVIGE